MRRSSKRLWLLRWTTPQLARSASQMNYASGTSSSARPAFAQCGFGIDCRPFDCAWRHAEEGLLLTETQIAALERKREEQQECGEIETAHPGYLGSQDTFYVGNMKGVGRIYQQTFVDTYAKVAFAKLYTTKTPIAAADLLNDQVLPFYQEHDVPLLRVLTDRGTEYCGKVEQHDYQLLPGSERHLSHAHQSIITGDRRQLPIHP